MSSINFKHTIYQLSLIFIAISLYCGAYVFLKKKLN